MRKFRRKCRVMRRAMHRELREDVYKRQVLNTTWITMELVTIGYIIKACSGGAISTAVGSLIGLVFMVAYTPVSYTHLWKSKTSCRK